MRKMLEGMLKITILLAVTIAVFGLVESAQATVVRLSEGMEIKVGFTEGQKVSGNKLEKGDSVDIVLFDPIIVDDSVIVEQGAVGKAVVTAAKGNGKLGKPGMIKVKFAYIMPNGAFKTDNDQPILISGEAEHIGKGKKTLSYATVIVIFGIFIKGEEGVLEPQVPYTAKITESIKLRSE